MIVNWNHYFNWIELWTHYKLHYKARKWYFICRQRNRIDCVLFTHDNDIQSFSLLDFSFQTKWKNNWNFAFFPLDYNLQRKTKREKHLNERITWHCYEFKWIVVVWLEHKRSHMYGSRFRWGRRKGQSLVFRSLHKSQRYTRSVSGEERER